MVTIVSTRYLLPHTRVSRSTLTYLKIDTVIDTPIVLSVPNTLYKTLLNLNRPNLISLCDLNTPFLHTPLRYERSDLLTIEGIDVVSCILFVPHSRSPHSTVTQIKICTLNSSLNQHFD